jgi:hypothetical protein
MCELPCGFVTVGVKAVSTFNGMREHWDGFAHVVCLLSRSPMQRTSVKMVEPRLPGFAQTPRVCDRHGDKR